MLGGVDIIISWLAGLVTIGCGIAQILVFLKNTEILSIEN